MAFIQQHNDRRRIFRGGDYGHALEAFQAAQSAYYDIYELADTHAGLRVSEILSEKIDLVRSYILADYLTELGGAYDISELYQEAIEYYKEADDIIKSTGDIEQRKKLLTLIFEAERKLNSTIEDKLLNSIRFLMTKAENDLNFDLAMKYCEVIADLNKELGYISNQPEEDAKRIDEHSTLNEQAMGYIEEGRAAAAAARAAASQNERIEQYENAVIAYGNALGNYYEMGLGAGHKQVIETANEMNRLDRIVQDYYTNAQAMEDLVQAGADEVDTTGEAGEAGGTQPDANQAEEPLDPGDAYG